MKVHKRFPKYGGKDYFHKFGFIDLINPFGVSGGVIRYINMHNPHLFTFGNTKLQLNKINEQNHNRALGAKDGVPNEDSTWEYKKILQHTNLELIEDTKS